MRLKYLDVLKAIAILAVVLYHSGFLTYGYLGVDLFLVINGYLITKGLCRNLLDGADTNWRGAFFLKFEISRIIRLLPVLLVAGLVCMFIGFWAMLPDDYENLSETVVATNCFANNILSAITTKDYWDISNEYKPLMHTWYVGLVMQFYIFYPLLFFVARLDKKNSRRSLLTMVSALALVSLLVYFGINNDAHRFYYLPSRFFEFAAGGIVALTWNPQDERRPFHSWLVYVCYVVLILLMVINREFVPSNIKLVIVVALTVILVMSSEALENGITGNHVLAKIGAASYSIFVWHQVLLAFYRYCICAEFTLARYLVFLMLVALLSWLTYRFVEQKTSEWLKNSGKKIAFYSIIIIAFIGLNSFAGYIYLHAGVVRDVPELNVYKCNIHPGMHGEYCDRVYEYNKPFETNKEHWLVVGNSFGRDFANVILESSLADSVELSYIYMGDAPMKNVSDRFSKADKVFLSTKGLTEEKVAEIESLMILNGNSVINLIIVGEKNFGESNGQFYIKRKSLDYFNLRTKVLDAIRINNKQLSKLYGERYLDLLSYVIDDKGYVPVFTPNHFFICQDCEHFTKEGAIYFASLINWSLYYN